jgi:hypothetical protein
MSPNQSELFAEIPPAVNPTGEFEQYRIGEKIINVPSSFWKDGRKRIDLTEFGGRVITSRNHETADQRAIEELLRIFQSRDELVREHDERAVEVVRNLVTNDRKQPNKPRLRNTSRGRTSPEVVNEPSVQFYRPCEYTGPFSNCPAGVDEMIGPTHLEKRLFAYAFALAKPYKVDRINLNWVRAAKALGATPRGVSDAASSLRGNWRLLWFRAKKGSQVGATVQFPRHPAIAIASSEDNSEEGGKSTPASSSDITTEEHRQSNPKCSEESSPSNRREKNSERKERKSHSYQSHSLGWGA